MSEETLVPRLSAQEKIDLLEEAMLAKGHLIDLPLQHRFTPGMYAREIFMPAGALLTSKQHQTEHVYVILTGKVEVFTEEAGTVLLEAPHVGVTKPGTRRVLRILEDCRWITFHPNPENLRSLDEIEQRLIQPRPSSVPGLPPVSERYQALLREQQVEVLEGQVEYGGAP